MSFIEGSRPEDPEALNRLGNESCSAPLEKVLSHEQSAMEWRKSASALKKSDRELSDSGEALVESDHVLVESDRALQESDRALLHSGQPMQEVDRGMVESDLTARESDRALRESDRSLRVSDHALRAADQALRDSRRTMMDSDDLFQLLVDSVTDYAIYMLDPEGHVVTWNAGAERSKGYKPEEILGKNFSIFFLPEDVAAGLPEDELATAESLGRYETEAWRVRKDGTKYWALVTLTAIRDKSGELRGFAKVTRDMSAQKTAEEAKRIHVDQLERYRIVLQNVSDYAIYTLDTSGRITSWGKEARRGSGYAAEEILGQEYSIFFTPEEIEAGVPQREMEEAARIGYCTTDCWRMHKDGSRFWVNGTLNAIRDEAGELTGFLRVARDMTQQKQAEEAMKSLNTQLERYRIAIESINEYFIYALDTDGRISTWSAGAQRLSGAAPEEMIGRPYSMFFTPEDRAAGEPERQLEEAARTGRYVSDAWMLNVKQGREWSSGVLNAMRDEKGELTGYIRVARVMTRQKEAEEKLKSLNAQLERYRIIVENVTDHLIYTLDAEGRIDSWSPSAQALVGYTTEEALGQRYAMNFLPAEIEAGEPQRQLEEAARTGHCITEGWRKRRDGSSLLVEWCSDCRSKSRGSADRLHPRDARHDIAEEAGGVAGAGGHGFGKAGCGTDPRTGRNSGGVAAQKPGGRGLCSYRFS